MLKLRSFAFALSLFVILGCYKPDASALAQSQGTSTPDPEEPAEEKNEAHIDQALLEESAALANERLPMDLGNNTRLDKVTAGPGRRIVFHATLVDRHSAEQKSGDLSSGIPELIKASCSSSSVQSFLSDDIAVTYKYKAADGAEITSIDVTRPLCVNTQGSAPSSSFKPSPLRDQT